VDCHGFVAWHDGVDGAEWPMASTGVVLGAGGIIGPACHLSVLRQVRADTGKDAADASLFVGTSGGAIVAALLAAGHTLDDLADAFAIDSTGSSDTSDPLHVAVKRLLTLPHLGWGEFRLPPRASRRRYPDIRQRIAVRSGGIFTNGQVDPLAYASAFEELFGDRWPARLRLCAVHAATGRRRVFGPTDGVSVLIEGELYSDGGFYSPTNADVALGHRLSAVTIVSPMSSGPFTLPASWEHPLRLALHALVAREMRQLRHHGATVTLIEPNFAARRIIGADYMDLAKAPAVAQAMTVAPSPATASPNLRAIA
jgi:NTE family protein